VGGAVRSPCASCCTRTHWAKRRARLRAIYESSDGFEIARQDLIARGPASISARAERAPLLRFADLEADQDLLAAARRRRSACCASFPLPPGGTPIAGSGPQRLPEG